MGVVFKSLEIAYNIRTHIVGENELILDHLAWEKYILLAQCTYSAKELHFEWTDSANVFVSLSFVVKLKFAQTQTTMFP